LEEFVRRQLDPQAPAYRTLKSRHFLLDGDSSVALDLLALKQRTRLEPLAAFTSLHIFVVSLRCDHSCPYCQVSRRSQDRTAFDMSEVDADHALDFVFRSPAPQIKIEFQGGEPLLNFPLIRRIVIRAEEINLDLGRSLQFVVASNLSYLTDEVLDFARAHDLYFSTSLDGPADLHDGNRPRPGKNSHQLTVDGVRRIRETLGADHVSALMTTTHASLTRPEDIIDEYVRQGFTSIFLRPLSPYGFAVKTQMLRKYDDGDWMEFYRRGLAHVLMLNREGIAFREEFTAIFLQKILTPYGTSYVDLQSPAGTGISAVVFNYDGDVYASDEGRMLAEMGDKTFRLGRLGTDDYRTIMTSDRLLDPLEISVAESVPMCSECAFLPYCGSDPVYHHTTQADPVGHKAFSGFCRRNMGILRHIFRLLEDDPAARSVLMDWV
jgi:His-Xaa-Ser system radical SAM maturase HxsB